MAALGVRTYFVVATLGLVIACAPDVPHPSLTVDREAIRWPLLVVREANIPVLVPPPPEAGSAEDAADLAAVLDWQARRTPADEAAIAHWNDGVPVIRWAAIARGLEAGEDLQNPPRTARALALTMAAIHDASLLAWAAKAHYRRATPGARLPTLLPWHREEGVPGYPSEHAAMAAAAAVILGQLYPVEAASLLKKARSVAETRVAAGLNFPSDVAAGLALGRLAGEAAIARAKADGAEAQRVLPEGRTAGHLSARTWTDPEPLSPGAGRWRPWVDMPEAEKRVPRPAVPGTAAFARELAEVRRINQHLSIRERALAVKWNEPDMALIWDERACGLLARWQPTFMHAVRTLATLHVIMADGAIASWDAQYQILRPRPTQRDPTIVSVVPTPSHPAYPSDRAACARIAATYLGAVWPDEAIALRKEADEAGRSGVWAGLHFPSDVEAGNRLGEAVARWHLIEAARHL